MKNFKTYEEFLNKFTPMAGSGNRDYNTEGVAESVVNEAKDVKSDVIDKLSQFFNVSTSALIKFKFDGKDDIRALTKALNGTDYEGVDNIVRVAILSAKRDLGIEESIVTESKTSAVYKDPKTGKGYDLQYDSSKKRWELDVMKKGASIYSNAITTIKRDTLAEIQDWLDGYNIDSSWTEGLTESINEAS